MGIRYPTEESLPKMDFSLFVHFASHFGKDGAVLMGYQNAHP